jgi:hypothetical protein
MAITASITVSFGAGADGADVQGHLSAEVDSRIDGLNAGRTSFNAGDTVYFLVYKSDNVEYDSPITSAGSASRGGSVSVSKTDLLTFANVNTADLSVPANGAPSITWLGRNLGGVTLGANQKTITAAATGVAVCNATYTASADVFALTSPASIGGSTDFSILVFIAGRVVAAP